jgi:hypothetical protein
VKTCHGVLSPWGGGAGASCFCFFCPSSPSFCSPVSSSPAFFSLASSPSFLAWSVAACSAVLPSEAVDVLASDRSSGSESFTPFCFCACSYCAGREEKWRAYAEDVRKRTSWGKNSLRRKCWVDGIAADGSDVRVEGTCNVLGRVDIRLYAAALPYALAGVAAAGCMLHRAVAANVLAVWGLMLWEWNATEL